mmetsp:Transcript_23040/g.39424  ORF Transcript_23040/g.39424 Transcript_23040/m.39424 type:complete len:207 (-) Transcript_23040:240-860(-)|eukprot:CAMPEP_0183709406 /NCGR_PEP_ID=MMETSP0737-20130205/5459_1 /TAXON_ID=385413 /ORGANISM="Thalassiosira miniscula, Strain CCMP1093" /LENGTH=206 /DNA_ID=CAMNT_0025937499 /DNA_START=99 /DNA_END=719 /DNA_ORIENTATION=-
MALPSARSFASLALAIAYFLLSCEAFAPQTTAPLRVVRQPATSSRLASSAADADEGSFIDKITNSWELFQKSRSEGYDFKQSVAITIAGEYDADAVQSKIKEDIDSAPCVMFTWESSPSCKQAVKYLDIAGASYKIVRLDDPWSEGNKVRAELGKMVGRSSVPCIFMGGQYVGGFDGGVGEESTGILEMAFKGTLREKLKEVGALE